MLGTGGSTGEAHYSQVLRLGRLQVNSNTENMNMNTTKGFQDFRFNPQLRLKAKDIFCETANEKICFLCIKRLITYLLDPF